MIVFENFPYDSAIFCPLCGTKNIPNSEDVEESKEPEKLIKDCKHFIYFGGENYDEANIDKKGLAKKFEEQDSLTNEYHEFLKKKLNDNFLLIEQTIPAPSFMTSYTIYDLKKE